MSLCIGASIGFNFIVLFFATGNMLLAFLSYLTIVQSTVSCAGLIANLSPDFDVSLSRP